MSSPRRDEGHLFQSESMALGKARELTLFNQRTQQLRVLRLVHHVDEPT